MINAAALGFNHANDCLEHEGGPCTCGLEEVLEDEAWEEAKEHLDPEDW